nr:Dihydrofolate reductase [uncultured bacterium]
MKITLVVAASENNVIGDSHAPNHAIPWHLPNDMKFFRDITRGKPVIMGRKTLEFIGHALPGRRNFVITRQVSVPFEGVEVVGSLGEALSKARESAPEEICVIGGGEIYRQALPLADRVYLTRVHAEVQGDTTFPELDPGEWKEVSAERHESDDQHQHAYTFFVYERISK